MGWRDTIQNDAAPQSSTKPSWRDTIQDASDESPAIPNEVKTAEDLQKKGYLFDDYYKLPPEEKAKYDAMQRDRSDKNATGLARGAQQGFPAAVGLHQEEISPMIERGIANVFGDDATKARYADLSDDNLKDTYKQQVMQAAKDAPEAFLTGKIASQLPANIAMGGLAGKGVKAAVGAANLGRGASLLTTAGGNVAAQSSLAGLSGYGNSQADTTEGRLEDAKKAAKVGALVSGAFETAGLAATPEAQGLFSSASDKVKDMAARTASKTLGLTKGQLAKLDSKGSTEVLGRRLLDPTLKDVPFSAAEKQAASEAGVDVSDIGNTVKQEDRVVTPFASAQSKADKLAALKAQTGEQVNSSAAALDQKVASAVTGPDAEKAKAIKDLLDRRAFTESVAGKTLKPLEDIQDPNNLGFRTKELLSKVGNIGSPADESIVAKNALEHASDPANSASSNFDKIEQLDKYIPDSKGFSAQAMPEDTSLGFPRNDVSMEPTQVKGNIIPVEKVIPGEIPPVPEEPGLMSFEGTNKFKQATRQGINYNSDSSASSTNIKNFTRELNDEALSRANKVAPMVGGEQDVANLVQANKDFGAVSTGAKAAANNAAQRELAKTGALAAGGAGLGFAVHGKTGAVEGAGLALAARYGLPIAKNMAAVGLDKLSNVIESTPQALGSYAPILKSAAQRGSASLAATNFVLQQRSPEYRLMTEDLDKSGEQPQE